MLKGHGDDIYNLGASIELNFSSNISPFNNDNLQQHLKNCISQIQNYPEPTAKDLAIQIESVKKLPENSVLVTNGAVEAFYLIARLFYKKHSLIFTPSFAEYEDACKIAKHKISFETNKNLNKVDFSKFDLVWICNPNNPDGKVFDSHILKEIISNNYKTLFVLDEAYIDFISEKQSLQEDIDKFDNLIIVASLTKRYAIPGLRLGYVVSNKSLKQQLNLELMPWRINILAIEAAKYCLSEGYTDDFDVDGLVAESNRVQSLIDKIEGFKVEQSVTSYFLCKIPCQASILKDYLIHEYKILIRDASNFRGLSANYIRISIRKEEQNNRLIQALIEWNNTL